MWRLSAATMRSALGRWKVAFIGSSGGAAAYAMFISNLLFEGMVVLLAFGIAPRLNLNIPTYVLYAAITLISGLTTFGFSYGFF